MRGLIILFSNRISCGKIVFRASYIVQNSKIKIRQLDRLSYEMDPYEYRDTVSDQEAQVQRIAEDIRNGNIGHLQNFLQTSIEEGTDENSEQRAKELLAKLAEYKPLAKIEEMEEQNYNMIDNVLNNGVEKINRKEDKQKLQQGRTSLKERLCTKQCEVSEKQGRDPQDQNKVKKNITTHSK